MKLSAIKWIIVFAALFVSWYVNNRYEVFALNLFRASDQFNGSFRVMTYNINAPLDDESEEIKTILINEINKQKPDILCLQESSTIFNTLQSTLDSLFNYTDSMAIKNQPYRYCLYSKKPIRNFKIYKCITKIDSIAIDSLRKEVNKLYNRMPVYSAEIEILPDKWINVFSCHLRSSAYSTARRSMNKDASWYDGIPLYYENYKMGQMLRNWEADNIRLHLEALEAEDTPVIIAGDFNDWSGSYCMNTIRDGKYKDAWWEAGFGLGITYDEWQLKLRLDHILYSHHFKLENVYVEKSKFSDHRPLIADFSLLP